MIIQHTNFGVKSSVKAGVHTNHNYGNHIHQFSELVWVLDGEMEMTVDGKIELGHKGDMFVITPYVVHSFKTNEYSKIFICVFSNDFTHGFFSKDEWYNGRRQARFTMSEELENYLLSRFISSALRGDADSYITARACIHAVLDEYNLKVPKGKSEHRNNTLGAILLYLSEHFNEDLSLESVGSALGYSKSSITHALEAIPGFNFNSLINSLRVEHAKYLLISTNLKSIDIALESGFSCERSFHRAFKQLTGRTPREYVKNKTGKK